MTGDSDGPGRRPRPARGSSSLYGLRILNAIRQMIRAADIDSRQLAADHGITAPQLLCLMAVVERGGLAAVEIANRAHLSASTLVGVLDRLEAKGLIRRERSSDDRRLVHVSPTREGRALVASTPFPLQHSLDKALRQLSKREQGQAAAWMELLVDLMGAREMDQGPMLEIAGVARIGSYAARKSPVRVDTSKTES